MATETKLCKKNTSNGMNKYYRTSHWLHTYGSLQQKLYGK